MYPSGMETNSIVPFPSASYDDMLNAVLNQVNTCSFGLGDNAESEIDTHMKSTPSPGFSPRASVI